MKVLEDNINATPISISTEVEMDAVLVTANIGKVYKYIGTSGKYINGDYYVIKQILGYNLNIIGSSSWGSYSNIMVKVNEAPTSASDYDCIKHRSSDISGTTTFTEILNVYLYTNENHDSEYTINSGSRQTLTASNTWDNPIHITLTSDTILNLFTYYEPA